ncbi:MAG: hypothetical protein ACKOA5_02270, partial [Actinomycetota bacterium]
MIPRAARCFGVLLATVSLLAGCGVRENDAVTVQVDPIVWKACGEVDCSTIRVPLDRFGPKFASSTRIELRAYREISRSPGSRHIPLIIHPGGPGSDVRAAVAGARAALTPIVDDFDIYALSTRGTVDGTEFDCGDGLRDLRVIDVDSSAAARFANDCVKRSAALVGTMGTRQSVEDLEDFRGALGFKTVRYLGWSY